VKKLAIFILGLTLISSPSFAAEYDFMFHADFLESANPGGWTYSYKTFEEEYTVNVGNTVEVDIWVHDVPLYEGIIFAGLYIEYNSSEIAVISVDVYDGVHGPPGPWNSGSTAIVTDPYYPDAYGVYTAAFYPCALPDSDGDLIVAKVSLYSSAPGSTSITLKHVPYTFEPTLWGCDSGRKYWAMPHTITIQQELLDSDTDGIPDQEDNCPYSANPSQTNSDSDSHGDVCDNCPNSENEDQSDADGDGIGDICDTGGEAIPTLSEWGIIIFMSLLMGISVVTLFKRRIF